MLLSPFVPLLFMGEEYGETAPFLYFTDHGDDDLNAAVRDGRGREFAAFARAGKLLDPHDPEAFARSRLDWSARGRGAHAQLLYFYRGLLSLRRELAPLRRLSLRDASVTTLEDANVLPAVPALGTEDGARRRSSARRSGRAPPQRRSGGRAGFGCWTPPIPLLAALAAVPEQWLPTG